MRAASTDCAVITKYSGQVRGAEGLGAAYRHIETNKSWF